MAIEIVDFPTKNCDFPWLCKRLPEGTPIDGDFGNGLSLGFPHYMGIICKFWDGTGEGPGATNSEFPNHMTGLLR